MTHDQFKDKLLAADTQKQSSRTQYERELAGMLESPLEWYRRAGLVFGTLTSIGVVILSAVLAARHRDGPGILLAGLAVGAAFGIAGAIMAGRILLRGSYRHRQDSTAQANLIWVFTVLMVTLFMLMDGFYPKSGSRMTIFGLVFLVGAAVLLLRTVIEQSELRTREKLLEIQYEMAEMKEMLEKSK
jgi:hypothetical protein